MKLKKFLTVFLFIFCCVTLVGCFGGGEPQLYVETTDTIFKFYQSNLLDEQKRMFTEIDTLGMKEDELLKVNSPRRILENNAREEMAIIAAVECYNMTTTPKEVYIDYQDDDIIHVKLVNRVYECKIYTDNNVYEYDFNIVKENGALKVNYKKDVLETKKTCKAEVVFNTLTSNLYIKLESYNTITGEATVTYKDFYALNNNYTALRLNATKELEGVKSMYSLNMFKEIVTFNIKISSITEVRDAGKINESELSIDSFKQTYTTEKCGFLVNYDSKTNKAVTYTIFGNINNWQ